VSARARALHPPVLLAVGIVLVAANLRPAAASVGPLIHDIRRETGLSGAGADLLTTLPVLCFGALGPLAPALARRLGSWAALAGALTVITLGLLVRVIPGIGFLFLGTIAAGAAVAIGNVLLPVLIRRSFAERAGYMTGLYATALIGFAALAAGLTVPIANWLGGGWQAGLAIWAVPATLALLVWLGQERTPRGDADIGREQIRGARQLLGSKLAWAVTLYFAIQSASFYATLAWLPSIFESHGSSSSEAGLLLSVSIIVGIAAAPTVPAIAVRMRNQRLLVLIFSLGIALGWVGILVAPESAPFLWAVILGIGQNASFPLALTLIVLRGGTVSGTTALSTLVQTVGYLLAALAPFAIGALHDLTGSWTVPLIVLLAMALPQALVGLPAARDRTVSLADQPAPDARGTLSGPADRPRSPAPRP
jgi:CP family cyanate transporter-like MFS transporter